jgi:hypothetical protein
LPSPVPYTQSMRNAPELLARLRELGRCMALSPPGAANEVRTACRTLAHTADADSPEIAAAGLDLAKAAEAVGEPDFNLRLNLCLQALMARIQTAAESSQLGRIWAAAQNLVELLLVVGKFLDRAPEPRWAEDFPPALCGLEAVRLEFNNLVSVLGWPTPDQFGLKEIDQALRHAGQLIDPAPEAPLCQYLAAASRDLVRPTHVAWIESHAWDDESPSPAQVYAWYWNETLGVAVLDGAKVVEAAATASALAKSLGLDEVVDYLRDSDKVAFYGMMNILPTTPTRWNLKTGDAASCSLHYGLARWYRRIEDQTPVLLPADAGARPAAGDLRAAHPAARNCDGRHRWKTGGLLRPDARRLPATGPVSSTARDYTGVAGLLERSGDVAFPRWAAGTVYSFGQRADHLRCPGEGHLRSPELKPVLLQVGRNVFTRLPVRFLLGVEKPSTILGKADGPTQFPETHPPGHQSPPTSYIHSKGRTLNSRERDSHLARR